MERFSKKKLSKQKLAKLFETQKKWRESHYYMNSILEVKGFVWGSLRTKSREFFIENTKIERMRISSYFSSEAENQPIGRSSWKEESCKAIKAVKRNRNLILWAFQNFFSLSWTLFSRNDFLKRSMIFRWSFDFSVIYWISLSFFYS